MAVLRHSMHDDFDVEIPRQGGAQVSRGSPEIGAWLGGKLQHRDQ
jgi:hypothetical protein